MVYCKEKRSFQLKRKRNNKQTVAPNISARQKNLHSLLTCAEVYFPRRLRNLKPATTAVNSRRDLIVRINVNLLRTAFDESDYQ